MVMPNFLVVGAAKAGTTSLHYYLSQHPQVYMSRIKEPRFFALEGELLNFRNPDQDINRTSITTLEDYQKLFQGVTNEIAIGETSPLYLYSPKAVDRIKYYIPDAKLITVLRNPVDRAFSCHSHLIQEGYELLSFAQGLQAEEERIQNNWAHLWHYRKGGYYYTQVKQYFDAFDFEQIRVYLYEDLSSNSTTIIQDIYHFLGVDSTFQPDLTRMNVSGIPKSRFLHNLFKRNPIKTALKPLFPVDLRKQIARQVKAWNLQEKPTLPSEIRAQLVEDYRDDILKLEGLIQRDLSKWLK